MGDVYDEDRSLPHSQRRRILVDDYVRVAKLAEEAGAAVIELNLSCPNSLVDNEVPPPICLEAGTGQDGLCAQIVHAVRAVLATETRLLVKLAYMDTQSLRNLITSIAEHIDGVSGINTVQTIIQNDDGSSAFGSRTRAGISGVAIRNFGIKFVKDLAEIRARERLSFEIIGMGGVTDSSSFLDMYNAGASVVQSATGVFSDYALASKCIEDLGDKLSTTPPFGSLAEAAVLTSAIRSLLERARRRRISHSMLIAEVDLPIAQINSAVDMMLADEEIIAAKNKHGLREYQLTDKR
jgi:dihydroorotate dehydrogenase